MRPFFVFQSCLPAKAGAELFPFVFMFNYPGLRMADVGRLDLCRVATHSKCDDRKKPDAEPPTGWGADGRGSRLQQDIAFAWLSSHICAVSVSQVCANVRAGGQMRETHSMESWPPASQLPCQQQYRGVFRLSQGWEAWTGRGIVPSDEGLVEHAECTVTGLRPMRSAWFFGCSPAR